MNVVNEYFAWCSNDLVASEWALNHSAKSKSKECNCRSYFKNLTQYNLFPGFEFWMHPCHFLSVSQRCKELITKLSSCINDVYFFAISANYAIDDIGGVTHEVISNLNRSFGSWYFLNILNERTSFASCLHAFESSSWSIVCIYLLAIELPMLCSASLEIILKLFKFLRMVDLTIWLRCWNVRVNGIPSVFSFCDIYLNARNRIATFF